MGKHTDKDGLVLSGSRKNAAICVNETFSGYIIGKGASARRRAAIGELAAIMGCLFFGAASFGQWLLPGSIYAVEALPFRISGTIMFFVFSALLYLIARRGLSSEVHVDTKQRNVRLVRRSREGGITEMRSFAFSEIGSVYIKRAKSDFIADQMFMRPRPDAPAILIANGPADELEPLLDRIQIDFRGPVAKAAKPVRLATSKQSRPRVRSAFATG